MDVMLTVTGIIAGACLITNTSKKKTEMMFLYFYRVGWVNLYLLQIEQVSQF
jgi:hypothetical protein